MDKRLIWSFNRNVWEWHSSLIRPFRKVLHTEFTIFRDCLDQYPCSLSGWFNFRASAFRLSWQPVCSFVNDLGENCRVVQDGLLLHVWVDPTQIHSSIRSSYESHIWYRKGKAIQPELGVVGHLTDNDACFMKNWGEKVMSHSETDKYLIQLEVGHALYTEGMHVPDSMPTSSGITWQRDIEVVVTSTTKEPWFWRMHDVNHFSPWKYKLWPSKQETQWIVSI